MVLVLIRISLTLADISASFISKDTAIQSPGKADTVASTDFMGVPAVAQDGAYDDTEIAAVIAIASAALRQAV